MSTTLPRMSDDKRPALLIQHPSAHVKFEDTVSDYEAQEQDAINSAANNLNGTSLASAPYRCTAASIERAKSEAAKERAEVDAACKAYDQERHAAILLLTEMVDMYGEGTVRRWLRQMSPLTGGAL